MRPLPIAILTFALYAIGSTPLLAVAQAQDEGPPPSLPPYSAPADGEPPGCFPACRPGFLCHRGQCVSECNPPCSPGEVCRPGGDCTPPSAPPPPFPPPEPEIEPRPHREYSLRFEMGPRRRHYPPPRRYAAHRWYRPPHEHEGFMLRVTLGLGGATQSHANPVRETLSGLAGMFSLDAGGSLAPNLVLHGRLSSATIANAQLTVDGDDRGTLDGFTVDAFLLGPALTYYFMPINIYVTAAVGLSWLSFEDEIYAEGWSEAGIGFNLDLGKEWWVRDNWGLGVAGRLFVVSAGDEVRGRDERETFAGLAVLFSATYQ